MESKSTCLQGILEELVHFGNLGRDAEVDGAVANLDNETSPDVWVDLYFVHG